MIACLYPKEAWPLIYFPVFFIFPAMNLLLGIYAVTNLNTLSWGTRELVKSADDEHKTG